MPVMTRKAAAQELELKLRTAVHDLAASNSKCQQLLQEIDESEKEVENVVFKNTGLKQELVILHQQYLDVVDERDKLRVVTDGFNNCSNIYEEALCKVRDLEEELVHANTQITKLQKQKECTQAKESNNLYSELLNTHCNQHSLVTIDLTEDSLMKHNNSSYKLSQNKIKKYAKLNRIINKCNKYRKQQKHSSNNIKLRKERGFLVNKLNNYQIKLEDSKNIYEFDTQHLQSEIQVLEASLHSLYTKYVRSEKQIQEHILAANELVDMCNSNADKVDLLKSNLGTHQPEATEDPYQSGSAQVSIPQQGPLQVVQTEAKSRTCSSKVCCCSILFSDSFGKGLGKLLSNNLSHSSLNYCMPQTSYNQIMSTITRNEYDPNAIITVLIGNSLNVKKEDITDSVTELLKLNCKKIIL